MACENSADVWKAVGNHELKWRMEMENGILNCLLAFE